MTRTRTRRRGDRDGDGAETRKMYVNNVIRGRWVCTRTGINSCEAESR